MVIESKLYINKSELKVKLAEKQSLKIILILKRKAAAKKLKPKGKP